MLQHGRVVAEVEAQRQAALDPDDLLGAEADQALRPGEGPDLLTLPDDLGFAGHGDQVARLEVEEEEAGPRVQQDVADRVEVVVAREIGNDEGPLVLDPDEAGPAAAVGDVGPLRDRSPVLDIGGGDEEGVRALDQRPGAPVEAVRAFDRPPPRDLVDLRQDLDRPGLDVLRAVAEGLAYGNREALRAGRGDGPGHAVAPPRLQLDAQDPDRGARLQGFGERVAEER